MFDKLHSKETIKKMRQHPFNKEILQFTITGRLLARYQSISEASRETNITRRTIQKALKIRSGLRLGKEFIWTYRSDFSDNDYIVLLKESMIIAD